MARAKVAAALGMFDGLHIAHTAVLKSALNNSADAICVTFDFLPDNKQDSGLLMQKEVKEQLLKEMGFKRIVSLKFEEVKDTPADEFLKTLASEYGVEIFCCGYDYRFGKDAKGNVELIKKFCEDNGFEYKIQDEYSVDNVKVSSSLIRKYVSSGQVEKAEELLTRPYLIFSRVVDGDKRGRVLGFPTINQLLPDKMVYPKFGVYVSETEINGRAYKSVTNIGVRPTFLAEKPLCETHIIGFSGDLYGEKVLLKFKKFLRGEQKFKNIEELKEAISKDLEYAYYSGNLI